MSFSILEASELLRSTFGGKGGLYIGVTKKQIKLQITYVDIENNISKTLTETISDIEIKRRRVDIVKCTFTKLVSKLKSAITNDK